MAVCDCARPKNELEQKRTQRLQSTCGPDRRAVKIEYFMNYLIICSVALSDFLSARAEVQCVTAYCFATAFEHCLAYRSFLTTRTDNYDYELVTRIRVALISGSLFCFSACRFSAESALLWLVESARCRVSPKRGEKYPPTVFRLVFFSFYFLACVHVQKSLSNKKSRFGFNLDSLFLFISLAFLCG